MKNMQEFESQFNYILQFKPSNKKVNENNSEYCYECNKQRFYDKTNDYYVCEICGSCKKAFVECHSYNQLKQTKIMKKSHRHKYIRLRKKFKKMKIQDEKLKDIIKTKFDQIIDYFDKTTYLDRKNILRYEYVILKFLEITNEIDKINYKLNLTKETIKKYDIIWKDFCELQNYNFIKTLK
jgi:hypothetical protein